MKTIKKVIGGMFAAALIGTGFAAHAQTNNQNMMMNNSRMMLNLATRLELWTDQFEDSLNVALDKSRADGSEFEDETLALVEGFEDAADRFRDRVEDNEVIASDVENLLSRALLIDATMAKAPVVPMARTDWMQIKQLLDVIAKTNNVVWVWTLDANPYWKTPMAGERISDRLESRADEFRRSFDVALDMSRFNGTAVEDRGIKMADDFENQVDRWEALADNERLLGANTELLLNRVVAIETFMRANNLTMPRMWRDWAQVKASLRELATASNTAWTWSVKPVATPATR